MKPLLHGLKSQYYHSVLISLSILLAGFIALQINQLRAPGALSSSELAAIEADKEAWNEMLTCHPFYTRPARSEAEWKTIPKKDRPDLAAELDFMKTMDPATGRVPMEKLYQANLEVEERLNRRDPIANVSWDERGPYNIGGRSRLLMFDPND